MLVDRVFTAEEPTSQLYQDIAKPLVVSSVEGYNGKENTTQAVNLTRCYVHLLCVSDLQEPYLHMGRRPLGKPSP